MGHKILVIDYAWCNFHNLIELVKSGHDVKVVTSSYREFEHVPHAFWDQYGVEIINGENRDSKLKEYLDNSDRDIVINTNPNMAHWNQIVDKDRFEYLGLTKVAATLELGKWITRDAMSRRMPPVQTPKIVRPVAPCVAKPIVCKNPIDHVSICLEQAHADACNMGQYAGKMFFEEYIPQPTIETNVDFVIAKGEWSIRHTQEIKGEDKCKMFGAFQHWTCIAEFAKLPDWVEEIVHDNAVTILDWAAKEVCRESSFIGQITGLMTPEGDWYFCELNVRPEQTCSLPIFVTGDEFLEAFRGRPEILGNAFPNEVDKLMVVPKYDDAPYPFELHEKYKVAIPSGLDIVDGEYRISKHLKGRQRGDNLIGMVVCDSVIPEGFIHDMNDSNFKIISKMVK